MGLMVWYREWWQHEAEYPKEKWEEKRGRGNPREKVFPGIHARQRQHSKKLLEECNSSDNKNLPYPLDSILISRQRRLDYSWW